MDQLAEDQLAKGGRRHGEMTERTNDDDTNNGRGEAKRGWREDKVKGDFDGRQGRRQGGRVYVVLLTKPIIRHGFSLCRYEVGLSWLWGGRE